jgi:hypothetical protein
LRGGSTDKGSIRLYKTNEVSWGSELHWQGGNLGLADGSAQRLDTPKLQRQFQLEQQAREAQVTRLVLPIVK